MNTTQIAKHGCQAEGCRRKAKIEMPSKVLLCAEHAEFYKDDFKLTAKAGDKIKIILPKSDPYLSAYSGKFGSVIQVLNEVLFVSIKGECSPLILRKHQIEVVG